MDTLTLEGLVLSSPNYRTPPNCLFEVDDFEAEWPYSRPFDFIHGRELEGCIADDDKLFAQAFKHLSPGGYFELQAAYTRFLSDDDTGKKATDVHSWCSQLVAGIEKFGKPIDGAPTWKKKLEEAGFQDVQQEILKVCNLKRSPLFTIVYSGTDISSSYPLAAGPRIPSSRNSASINSSSRSKAPNHTRPPSSPESSAGATKRFRCSSPRCASSSTTRPSTSTFLSMSSGERSLNRRRSERGGSHHSIWRAFMHSICLFYCM